MRIDVFSLIRGAHIGMPVARDDDARGDPRVSSPRDAHATWSDPRPRAFQESPTRIARDHTRDHAHAHPPAPYTPPPEASASSVAAAAGSALAALGKEVLALGRFPGCAVDLVAVRAATSLDFRRCVGARAEHANLVSRAKHTPRAVGADDVLDALDARDDVTHVYVTYDHPDSRHTLGVARVAAPAAPAGQKKNAGRHPQPRSDPPDGFFSAPKVRARPGGDIQARILRNDHASAFESAQHPFRAFKVNTLFATGLATALDPSGGPERVKALLLRACEEAAARTLRTQKAPDAFAELVIEAPRGALPREATRRVLDAVSVHADADDTNGDRAPIGIRADVEPSRGPAPAPKLRLRLARYRLRANNDLAPNDGDEETRTPFEPLDRTRRVNTDDDSVGRSSSSSARRGSLAEARRALAAAAKKALGATVSDENDLIAALAAVVGGPESSPKRGDHLSEQSLVAFSASAGETVAALEAFRRASRSESRFLNRGGALSPDALSGGGVATENKVTVALVDRFPIPRSTPRSIAGDRATPTDAASLGSVDEARRDDSVDDSVEDFVDEKDDGTDANDAFARRAVVASLRAMRDAIPRDGALALVMRVTRTTSAARGGEPGASAVAVRVETPLGGAHPAAPAERRTSAGADGETEKDETTETRPRKPRANRRRNPFRDAFGRWSRTRKDDRPRDPPRAVDERRRAAAPRGAETPAPVPETTTARDFPLHEFLLAAAEMGLLLEPAGFGCLVDGSRAFAAVRLCRPGYRVRFARPEDVDALVAIEAANWPDEPAMRTPRAVVEARVARNPSGNLVLTEDPDACVRRAAERARASPLRASPRVKGGVYFQRTASLESAAAFSWHEKERAGKCRVDVSDDVSAQPYAQLLDIHVDQTFSRSLGRAVGNELRAFVLNVSMVTPGVAGVCAVTRTRGYRRARAKAALRLAYEDYVLSAAAARRDRGLFFHVGGGATVVKPVLGWRPADVENDGKGTLIEYPLRSIAADRWLAARRGVGAGFDAADAVASSGTEDARETSRAANEDDDGSGSESESDSEEPAVTVEVSFTSDALSSLEDKE